MTLRNCYISFDKHAYLSGETVAGKVSLNLEKNKLCSALLLNILGKAQCSWSETDNANDVNKTTYHQAKCTHIQTSNNLMAEQQAEVGSSHLIAGNHTFDFAFVLPENLPSSMKGLYGYIRYTAQIVLKRDYKSDLSHCETFNVLSRVDLNHNNEIKKAIRIDRCKNFYFFFAKKGQICMTVKIPFSGYVSGQNIPIICHIKNQSKVKSECVKFALIKKNYYYAEGERTSEIKKIMQIISGETLCGEEKAHDVLLCVPSTTPSTFPEFGSIIDTKYELKVTVAMSGIHGNMSCAIPIIIGTVPLVSNLLLPVDEELAYLDSKNHTKKL